MKLLIVIGIIGSYLAGMRWLSDVADVRVRQVGSSYAEAIDHPERWVN
ncbi:hypothetical protein KY386_02500 [Candidatus Parcubacteria bacterium]|nr:hypothetical protein [Candidatus Parcubacteria bacterium]